MCICVCIYIIFLWELPVYVCMALVAQWVKNLPAKQEMQVRSLDLEDPLEEVMATHFSIVAWEIHGQRSLVVYSPWDHKRARWSWVTKQQQQCEYIHTHTHTHTLYICVYICTHIHTYTGNSQKKIKYKWNIRKDAQPHWGFKKCQSKQQQKKSFHQTNRHVLEVLQIWYWKENIKVRKLIYCWSKFKLVYTFGMQFGNVSTCSNVLWASPKIYPRNILIKATWYR